ncbi:hypothetical protein R1flu_003177 [Riccia fluitans]|uniref:peptidylprolyl isomerase n=1 Tax=Riccia fluitans TaxID=41844 RepID=A0ABD1YBA2_9MARC
MANAVAMASLVTMPAGLNTSTLQRGRHGSPAVLSPIRCVGSSSGEARVDVSSAMNRREAIGFCGLAAAYSLITNVEKANAAGLPEEEKARLCDPECEKELENIPTITTASGLQYKDIVVGKGASPPIGYQVYAHYVAMIPNGKIFDSSLEKGSAYTFRVGSGQVIKGLDEGVLTMKIGGKRRLYIPGELAFPKGLGAAAGRPRVPPSSPVIFDVNLLLIPGLEDLDEE